MKHKHAEVLNAIAEGKEVQCYVVAVTDWITFDENSYTNPLTWPSGQWRVKPEMIMIGDMEVPKPCREAPPFDTVYYYPFLSHPTLHSDAYWDGDRYDLHMLAAGMLHLTAEAAIAHAKALIKISGGTYD